MFKQYQSDCVYQLPTCLQFWEQFLEKDDVLHFCICCVRGESVYYSGLFSVMRF